MIKNYFKIAWRNIQSDKVYSAINIGGLTIGLASCLLVATVVLNDLSYDKQWSKGDEIYRIVTRNNSVGTKTMYSPLPLGPELKKDFPQVEAYTRISTSEDNFKFGTDDAIHFDYLKAEPTVWDVLDIKTIGGSPKKMVHGKPNLIISQNIKDLYFADSNPIGKTIKRISNYEEPTDCIITGVIENLPSNSYLHAEAILIEEPAAQNNILDRAGASSWGQQFIVLQSGASAKTFANTINTWFKKKMKDAGWDLKFSLQPIKDVYLKSEGIAQQKNKGNLLHTQILVGAAILLLLIACINFINLGTARATKRIKETGIKKILGAGRNILIAQLLIESLLFFAISFGLAALLYSLAIPYLENFVGSSLTINIMENPTLLLEVASIIIIVSLLTGIYPAWLLSRPSPTSALVNSHRTVSTSAFLRKGLVLLQFAIIVGILVSVLVIQGQLNYLNNKDLGFDKENLISLDFTSWGSKGAAFKKAIKNIPGVEEASIANWHPNIFFSSMSMDVDDPISEGNMITVWRIYADKDLAKTLKLKLIKGSFLDGYSAKYPGNKNQDGANTIVEYGVDMAEDYRPVLITEYTAKRMGVTELNKISTSIFATPVGIVKNFNNESLRNPLSPTVITSNENMEKGNLLIRLNPNTSIKIIGKIHKKYKEFYPNAIFGYSWISNDIAKEFRQEQNLGTVLILFGCLIIFLSCLGLFGLITFMVQTRVKEISIRKVMGASVSQITSHLSKGSMKPVLLSLLVAIPITWYGLHQWLMKFPYRIDLDWKFFVQGAFITLIIAFLTISIRVLKAAVQNPANNLRNE